MHDKGIMDCNEIAKDAALKNPKMEFVWNTVVDSFAGDDHLQIVNLKNVKTGEIIPVSCDTCFEFIGYLPNSEIFKDQVSLTSRGYIPTNEKMETNLRGVYAAGDIRDKWLKQIATAVGDGAIAACAAEKFIQEEENFHELIVNQEKPVAVFVYNAVDKQSQECLFQLKSVEETHKERYVFVKVDVYKSLGMAERLGIQKYPSLVVVNHGEVVSVLCEDVNASKMNDVLSNNQSCCNY
jgi:thioredoxin reductase (NADPH)